MIQYASLEQARADYETVCFPIKFEYAIVLVQRKINFHWEMDHKNTRLKYQFECNI